MANWMVERGARKLALTSRSGVKTGYEKQTLHLWKNRGILVEVYKHDVSNFKQTQMLFQEAEKYGPIGGVFHLAAVSIGVTRWRLKHVVQWFKDQL